MVDGISGFIFDEEFKLRVPKICPKPRRMALTLDVSQYQYRDERSNFHDHSVSLPLANSSLETAMGLTCMRS